MSKAPVAVQSALESTLGAGALLSAIGGFLDAYTYIGHGMVFANAQSGNVLFAALALGNAQWSVAVHHIPPIIALFVGTFFVRTVQLFSPRLQWRAASVCLAVESLVLLINAAMPQLVAGFTPARTGGREVMWHERALALRVVKKSIFMLFLAIVYQDYI